MGNTVGLDRMYGNIPENTQRDRNRFSDMNIKYRSYGGIFLPPLANTNECSVCNKEIEGQYVKINGVKFHNECFNSIEK